MESKEKIIFFNHWGLGDFVMSLPLIKKLSEKYVLSVVLGSKINEQILKDEIKNIEVLIFKKDLFFLFKLTKILIKNKYLIIPSFFNIRMYLILKFLCFFTNTKIFYKRNIKEHRVISTWIELLKKKFLISGTNLNMYHNNIKTNSSKKIDVLIHPGSDKRFIWKRYPIYKINKLIRFLDLQKLTNFSIILGPDDKNIESKINIKFRKNILYSKSHLELKYILQKSKILISSDSGIGHYASYLGVKTISLFGPTNSEITHPYNKNTILKGDETLKCLPCINTKLWGNCDKRLKCFKTLNERKIVKTINKTL